MDEIEDEFDNFKILCCIGFIYIDMFKGLLLKIVFNFGLLFFIVLLYVLFVVFVFMKFLGNVLMLFIFIVMIIYIIVYFIFVMILFIYLSCMIKYFI